MNNNNNNISGDSKYVSELRASDVLFGRGSGPNDHIGNIRFRQYVAERKAQYMSTNHRLTKTKIAREIVNLVWQEHGRFVKKVEAQELITLGLPEHTEYYELVDDETIMEKAKQALRQNQNSAAATAVSASTSAAAAAVPSSSAAHTTTKSSTTTTTTGTGISSAGFAPPPSSGSGHRSSIVSNSSSKPSSQSQPRTYHHPSIVSSSSGGTINASSATTMMSSGGDISYTATGDDLEPLPFMTTSESQIPLENNVVGIHHRMDNRNPQNNNNSNTVHRVSITARDVVPDDWNAAAAAAATAIINNNNVGVNRGSYHDGYDRISLAGAATTAATTTTAITHHPNEMMLNPNIDNYISNRNHQQQDYQHIQRQRLHQLQEQQRLLHHQQQQLQLQMAAMMNNNNDHDDTAPLPLHPQQQSHQQQRQSMISLEQQTLLRMRHQQQQEQEQQLAAAIRSLGDYPIIQNTSTSTNTTATMTKTETTGGMGGGSSNINTSNNLILLDDHNQFNSSMAQLPHEDVSYLNKRNSIRIEDLEHVRAFTDVQRVMNERTGGDMDGNQHDAIIKNLKKNNDDDTLSPGPVGDTNNMSMTAILMNPNHLTSQNQHVPSMNSINNFSMSLQHIQRGNIDELMGSFNQMKTPSMEVNLENSAHLSSLVASDPSSSQNKNKNSSSSMLTQEELRSRMMASTETMGTIEPLGSTTDMSLLMGSSTFSLFRHGNESVIMEESGTTGTTTSTSGATAGSLMQRGVGSSQLPLHEQNSINQSQLMNSVLTRPSMGSKSSSKTSSSLESNNSFHLSDMFTKSSTNNSMSMAYVMSGIRQQLDEEDANDLMIHDSSNYIYDEKGKVATLPHTIGVMAELPDETNSTSNQNSTDNLEMISSSTFEVLQNALLQSTEIEGNDDSDVLRQHPSNENDIATTKLP